MKELTPEQFDEKVSADAAASGGVVTPVKMVRRCSGCNRVLKTGQVKCCNAFFDSGPIVVGNEVGRGHMEGQTRRTGRPKLPKKRRLKLRRYVQTVEMVARLERVEEQIKESQTRQQEVI